MKSKCRIRRLVFWLLLFACCIGARAQGTAFTYQGRLIDGASPANGHYDLTFALFNAGSGGSAVAGPIASPATPVSNGLFTVTLDFGSDVFNGSNYWLQTDVRSNNVGGFTPLSPRQPLTPAPYAIFAEGASNVFGVVPSGGLSGGYSGAVAFGNAANQFNGSFAGNGGGLTNVNALALGGIGAGGFWKTTGNSGTTSSNFLGTTENQALEIRVNGMRALRLQPDATGTNGGPSLIGGSPANFVAAGITAGTIAGGGSTNFLGLIAANTVAGDYGTIGGGGFNSIRLGASEATIGGGFNNSVGTNSTGAAVAGGDSNWVLANVQDATVGGGYRATVQPGSDYSTISGGYSNQTAAAYATVGGGGNNTASGISSTVAGGSGNLADNNDAAIAGGYLNRANFRAGVGSGEQNDSDGDHGFIGGGFGNNIQTDAAYSFIGSGAINTLEPSASFSVIAGGLYNAIRATVYPPFPVAGFQTFSVIGGGIFNTIQLGADGSFLGGGSNNVIQAGAYSSFLGGGVANNIQANAMAAMIGGGSTNVIQTGGSNAVIAGGALNLVQAGAYNSSIGGGANNTNQTPLSTIGGGSLNLIQNGSFASAISGGFANTIMSNATNAVIAGGTSDAIQTGSFSSTIGGGYLNVIQNNAQFSTIDGGAVNTIWANAALGTIGGGTFNTIGLNAALSTIGGGNGNVIGINATNSAIGGGGNNYVRFGIFATIAGGYQNYAGYDSASTGNYASVGGGFENNAQGDYSTTPGGNLNWAPGKYSFAAGNRAKATADGTFVWADSQNTDFTIAAANQVAFRCAGGVVFTSGSVGLNQSVTWAPGGGSWSFSSDRALKDRLQPVDSGEVLEKVSLLPILEWSYRGYPQRHIGAMAQDFHALFPLNPDDKSLNDADLHGVELAAIQGLNQKLAEKLEQKETEITELKTQNQNLEKRLDALEQIILRRNDH
jgi:hypothetical protein